MNEKKFSLAWFKISDALLRSEREKAFFVYRLLSHSLDNESFKYHIIGDMHLLLDEKDQALQAYQKAFYGYCELKEFSSAYMMIVIISTINKNISEYLEKLAEADHVISLYVNFIDDIIYNLEQYFSFTVWADNKNVKNGCNKNYLKNISLLIANY